MPADCRDEVRELVGFEPRLFRRPCEIEGLHRHTQRVDIGLGRVSFEVAKIGTAVGKQRTNREREDRMVGPWTRRKVPSGKPCAFRAPRVDHPQLARACGERTQPIYRIGERGRVTVAHHGVRADEDREARGFLVNAGHEPSVARKLVTDQRPARRVDGDRGVARLRAEGLEQPERHTPPGGVERGGRSHVHADRVGAVLVRCGLEPPGQITERGVPVGGALCGPTPDARHVEPLGVMMPCAERSSFGAGVAPRQRVIGIATNLDDLVSVDGDDDAA